jgi:hypothetical protein
MNAVRRLGTSPTGLTPAIAASSSHQAPAALTNTGAENSPAGVLTHHRPAAWLI